MKMLIPVILALLGLGAGIGAGLALKPPPPPPEDMAAACGDQHAMEGGGDHAEAMAEADKAGTMPCDPQMAASDPFAKTSKVKASKADKDAPPLTYVPIEKPFVVPVFADEKVTAMVVISVSVETGEETVGPVQAMEPRLRDRFLKVMFLHSNSGGFDGSFTSGRKMADLKSALLKTANEVLSGGAEITDVLITDIARQDV